MPTIAFVRTLAVSLVLSVVLAGCFGAGAAKTAGPTPEQQKVQSEHEELERLRQAEKDRKAQEEAFRKVQEEKAAEEARKKAETALPEGFGKTAAPDKAAVESQAVAAVPPVIAGSGPGENEQPAVPYDQAFPPIPDRLLRVAVISAPSQANVAERIGVMLSETERDNLERSLGMGLRIAYLSQAEREPKSKTRIEYREKFMQAAVKLAGMIPEAQRVERMTESEASRMGVDVLINVGSDLH